MILNTDCVRDVLICFEQVGYNKTLSFNDLSDSLSSYSSDELQYSCFKLDEAGFIKTVKKSQSGPLPYVVKIIDITYDGYQFLENVRETKNWEKTKSIAKSVGSFSVNAISQIASSVISAAISSQIGP